MNDILYRAAAYLLIIALGVFLKKVGFFHEQDFRTLAKILLNITLPCAIIYSFSKVDFQISLLTVTGLSLFVGILMMFIAFFTSRITVKKHMLIVLILLRQLSVRHSLNQLLQSKLHLQKQHLKTIKKLKHKPSLWLTVKSRL